MEESTSSTVLEGELVSIRFGLASHNEIRKSSISDCPISHASQLANPFLGLPLEIGKCESCGTAEPGKCEGHFGYIELPIPVYHPSHISELKRLLGSLCLKCLKLKTSKPAKNTGIMEKLLSGCCEETCHVTIKESKNSDGASFLELRLPTRYNLLDGSWDFLEKYGYRYGDGSSRTLLPSEVSVILKKLPEETRRKLQRKGYFPQDGYIMRYIPVPPNCLSVPDISDGVSVMSSDISASMLKKVLRQIEGIRSSRSGDPNFESHEVEANELQIAISQYLQVRGTGKALREADTRFGVSKEGNTSSTKAWLEKMRTLFISKGSGFSSRSVITGDAYKSVNEVGIPSEIAQKMTFEERVNNHNIQFLQLLVDNNLCLTFKDGSSTYSLREGSKGHTFLKPGQIVHRRIMDGDIVFINRPPTTHKHSLQALRVYIHEDHTVKINPLMCGPLGADFDGDCVHLFYPQSLAARAEVVELFSVEKQLLSSHSGNLNLQLATDALLSLKSMFRTYFLDKATAQQLAMYASSPLPFPALIAQSRQQGVLRPCLDGRTDVLSAQENGHRKKFQTSWTALQVLQTALPVQFSCHGDRLLICGSELVKLDYNRDVMVAVINEIVTSLFFSKSPMDSLKFYDSLQPLLMEHLFAEGFSVGLNDFFIPLSELHSFQSQIQDTSSLLFQLRSSFNELVKLQFESFMRQLKLPVSNFILKSSALGYLFDSRSDSAIDKVVQQIGFLGLQLSDRRKFYSKGLVQEVASLFHHKYPYSNVYPSEEFGLVRSCFFRGLDPYEGMVHSIATREVIVRSSKGLAEPGTLFKNLMAILRDVVICYDGSVRNLSSNSIIQFEYGIGGVPSETLFPPGEPVGVLAATAMSNPAYKAVLDSSPSSNSSWDMMKEILFCRVNFKNDVTDRRVILYLNDCDCGRRYCQENASYIVKSHLQKVSLRDAAVEFLIEYKQSKVEPGSSEPDTGLVGHIHLNKALVQDANISMPEILQKCEDEVNVLRKKKKYGYHFRRILLSVSDCCVFQHANGKLCNMPCLKFFWQDASDAHLEKISHVMADFICPILLDTIIKGDPRISTVNIVWINPNTTTWVQGDRSSSSSKGELAVEVTLEKAALRQSGDAWRIVLDCCLPVFHLVDTRHSIPYAIKQIQELFGISCTFDQAVQRLSSSVTSVTKGVLKEHLILLASSMTCAGNLVGFNKSGIKALCHAMNVQVPFTEATLYTPRKCFERASEKCHVDSLASIVASCSWGKRVAVGTGAKFDLLWDKRETAIIEEQVDIYNFLQLVRSSNEEDMDTGCLGEDSEKLGREDIQEPPLSPEQENKATFEELVQGGESSWEVPPPSESAWDAGNKDVGDVTAGNNGWSSWGQKKDPTTAGSSGTTSAWDKPASEAGNVGWQKSDSQAPKTDHSGWDNKVTKETKGFSSSDGWGQQQSQTEPTNAQTEPTNAWNSSNANGGARKSESRPTIETSGKGTADCGNDWAADHQERSQACKTDNSGWDDKVTKETKESSSAGGWGQRSVQKEPTNGWNSSNGNDGAGTSGWGRTPELSRKETADGGNDWAADLQQKKGNGNGKGWGFGKEEAGATSSRGQSDLTWKGARQDDGDLGSTQPRNTSGWGSGRPNTASSSKGWCSDEKKDDGKSSWVSKNEGNSSSAPEQSSKSTWTKPQITEGDKFFPPTSGWNSASVEKPNDEDRHEKDEGNGWGSKKEGNPASASKSTWNNPRDADVWGSNKPSQPSNSSKWGSAGAQEQIKAGDWDSRTVSQPTSSPAWGPEKISEPCEGGFKTSWSKKEENGTQSSWGRPGGKNSTESEQEHVKAGEWDSRIASQPTSSPAWGSEKTAEPFEGGSKSSWSEKEKNKTQSSWGLPSNSDGKNSTECADDWGSKVSQPTSSPSWGPSKTNGADGNDSQSPWGQPGSSDGRRRRPEGGRGWASSSSGEWQNRKNRPLKPGGQNDDFAGVALTATRRRVDLFTNEEQDALAEVEKIMLNVRRIMYPPRYKDVERLPDDDQAYVTDNVLNYHPDRAAKVGAGIDFITVQKHSMHNGRCFHLVSSDGRTEDFSYIKCLENLIKTKHPAVAESFIAKYFTKPRPAGNDSQSAPNKPRPAGNDSQGSPSQN